MGSWTFGHVADIQVGSPRSFRFAPAWNENWAYPRLRMATMKDFFTVFEKREADKIPRYRKAWCDWWADGVGAGADELAIVKQSQELGINTSIMVEETGCAALQSSDEKEEGAVCASILEGFKKHPNYAKFRDKYRNKYGRDPAYGLYQAAAYDSIKMLAEAISKGDDIEEARDYLLHTDFAGISGNIRFDKYGNNKGSDPATILIV